MENIEIIVKDGFNTVDIPDIKVTEAVKAAMQGENLEEQLMHYTIYNLYFTSEADEGMTECLSDIELQNSIFDKGQLIPGAKLYTIDTDVFAKKTVIIMSEGVPVGFLVKSSEGKDEMLLTDTYVLKSCEEQHEGGMMVHWYLLRFAE